MLIATGNALVPLRAIFHNLLLILASNVLICAGVLAIWRGCRLMIGQPTLPWIERLLLAGLTAPLAYFLYAVPDTNARIIINSVFICGLSLHSFGSIRESH